MDECLALGTPGWVLNASDSQQHIIDPEDMQQDHVAGHGVQDLDLEYFFKAYVGSSSADHMSADHETNHSPHRCGLCKKTFKQKSSLVRHSKKCTLEPTPSVRQKACRHCTQAKARCDLGRPSCSRCSSRGVPCVYLRPSKAAEPTAPSSSTVNSTILDDVNKGPRSGTQQTDLSVGAYLTAGVPDDSAAFHGFSATDSGSVTPDFFANVSVAEDTDTSTSTMDIELPLVPLADLANLSFDLDQQVTTSTASDIHSWVLALASRTATPDPPELVNHSMQSIFRVFRSWPRMLAKGIQLPPMIHFFQFREGAPRPLANCITLCKMWTGQAEDSGRIVEDAVRGEMEEILAKYRTYDAPNLLSALQSLVILLLLVLFPSNSQTTLTPIPSPLSTEIQHLAYYIASTGVSLQEESTHVRPNSWQVWAHIEAKRRALLSLYFIHWAYSVYQGTPHFNCLELGRMLAPGAKYLWQATDETTWKCLYTKWLAQWEGRELVQAEFFLVERAPVMERRMEMWLEDADELGVLVLTIMNASQRDLTPIMGGETNFPG